MNKFKLPKWLPLGKTFPLGVPILVLSVLSMVILPLNPLVLDCLFTFNIVLAILILLVSVNAQRPLDFSIFPTLLLITTLLRLSLNVASTRVVLLHGHEGEGAAGKVIEAFGQVVIGGDFVVGLVVFIILMIVNFVVITKGAERISEVSARFTLDAMPGKQMAIDAELNAGAITQTQARARRAEVTREADFYGSMDGASKFVRGDAIAGMLILVINMVGGIAIGMAKYHLDASQAFQQYVLLTIGDGLVAQLPSLLLSTAAAIIVTRVSDGQDIRHEVREQLLAQPTVLYTVAGIMLAMALVPGMPHIAFLSFTLLLAFTGWRQSKRIVAATGMTSDIIEHQLDNQPPPLEWEGLTLTEPLGLNLGYKLVNLIDQQQGGLLSQRITGVRQILSENSGVLLPEIQVRENFRLKPTQYSILVQGIQAAVGEVYADKLMALASNEIYGELDGILGTDPAYGMSAIWIDPSQKSQALRFGYQVVDCASVIATHVNKIAKLYLPDLFQYDDITHLHKRLAAQAPRLSDDLNHALTYTQQLRIYRYLLLDGVSLKDIVTIATALLIGHQVTKDPLLLAADVRYALRRHIVQEINKNRSQFAVFTLSDELENLLLRAQQAAGNKELDNIPLDPHLLSQLQTNMPLMTQQMKAENLPPVLIVPPALRPLLARYARSFSRELFVLSYNEVPEDREVVIRGHLT
ncbi:flagellar biosynthesis protein FlhA [Rosenbergiella australiborealis]|uniref:flagellar biosynthesis protein FlhA n=1 Tax=Rosenbergiella australiborealis TaxID=1544696 RepID=UPI0030B8BF53